MTTPLRIDFVSDVSCPWCAIGLNGLQQALRNLQGDVQAELHFQPFELNPQMAPEGEDVLEHLARKYGSTPEQAAGNQEAIRARGAAVGFTFNMGERRRIYNTFDAHRLLYWAEQEGRQAELKHALFKAYFTDGKDPSDHAVLTAWWRRLAWMPRARRKFWAVMNLPRTCAIRNSFFLAQRH